MTTFSAQCLKIILICFYHKDSKKLFQCLLKYVQPGTVAYAAGWGAIITDEKLGPLGFLVPKEQKRPKVLQVNQDK